jgi:hypothetical protein
MCRLQKLPLVVGSIMRSFLKTTYIMEHFVKTADKVLMLHDKSYSDMWSFQKLPLVMGSVMWSFCKLHIAWRFMKTPLIDSECVCHRFVFIFILRIRLLPNMHPARSNYVLTLFLG